MIPFRKFLFALGLGLLASLPAGGRAQEAGKSSDEALDSLIEKLGEPKSEPPGQDAKPAGDESKPKEDSNPSKGGDRAGPGASKGQPTKSGSGEVSGDDKELDDLLEKLGETKDQPDAPGKPGGAQQPGEPGEPGGPGWGGDPQQKPRERSKGPDLQGKDREIDERLEEFAGKRRKKNRSEQEDGGGPLSQLIKEMREVEQKLGKPETGEDTQAKQKQIVKQIETLIQQVKQSGSSGQMAMKQARQQGQKPGEQQKGQTPGANAGGAPPMKPMKPPDRHALAGGKDVWGHLPPELRQEMENVFKEDALPAKEELIRLYYLSIAKQKLQRGE